MSSRRYSFPHTVQSASAFSGCASSSPESPTILRCKSRQPAALNAISLWKIFFGALCSGNSRIYGHITKSAAHSSALNAAFSQVHTSIQSSPSTYMTYSPDAYKSALFRADETPAFSIWNTEIRASDSAYWFSISPLPSVDPSSIQIISMFR